MELGLHPICTKTESRLCSFSVGLAREERTGLLQGAVLQGIGLWWQEADFHLYALVIQGPGVLEMF